MGSFEGAAGMRIIISPAKRMRTDTDTLPFRDYPVFLKEAEQLKEYLQCLTAEECRKLWNCNEKIAELNYRRVHEMDLRRALTPALIAYEGIQYQYMAPVVLEDGGWEYLQEHLRILSGFYGMLRPLDGVVPYRLEMQAPVCLGTAGNLYQFWGRKLSDNLSEGAGWVLNLASKEYSRSVISGLPRELPCITCVFGEEKDGKIIEKGTLVKMARGEMVRFLAERKIREPDGVRMFSRLNYQYREDLSDTRTYVFVRKSS